MKITRNGTDVYCWRHARVPTVSGESVWADEPEGLVRAVPPGLTYTPLRWSAQPPCTLTALGEPSQVGRTLRRPASEDEGPGPSVGKSPDGGGNRLRRGVLPDRAMLPSSPASCRPQARAHAQRGSGVARPLLHRATTSLLALPPIMPGLV